MITVNDVGYQSMVDLSPRAVEADRTITPEIRGMSQYDIPLFFKPRPQQVLVVGAGSGNDVAGALRAGAEHVTAVDIDPAIIDMGRRYHPEHPYDSDKVRVVNDDARSFFATTNDHYDLIIFGLLDSHTTTSMTNARLDHYVYTRESLERARSLLKPGGVVVLTFMVQEPFIADRIARSLREVFGHEPLVFGRATSRLGWGGVAFVTGDQQSIAAVLAGNPKLRQQIAAWQKEMPIELPGTTPVATDDWPYIYLASPRIPVLYFLLAGLLGGLFWYGQRRLKIRTFRRLDAFELAFFLSGRSLSVARSAKHQQGGRGAGKHLAGERRGDLGRAGDDPAGEPGGGLLPAVVAKGNWLRIDRRLPGFVLHRPVAIRLPALRAEGHDRRRVDRSADVLQRADFHPLVLPRPAEGSGAGCEPDRLAGRSRAAIVDVHHRDQGPAVDRGRVVCRRLADPAEAVEPALDQRFARLPAQG